MVTSEPDAAPWLGPRLEEEGLQRYVRTIRERWRVVVACVALALIGAAAHVTLAPKVYKATSQLLVTPVEPSDPATLGLGLISTSNDPGRDVATAASLVTTVEIASSVIAATRLSETPRKLLTKVSAVPLANTSLVSITASASTPKRAQTIANGFAQQTVAVRTQRVHGIEDQAIALLKVEVAHLPKEQLNASGNNSVAARLAGLEALRAQPDPTISIAALADLPTSQSSPRKALSLAAGLFAGLILGLGAAFVLQNIDPRLRREEQLRELFRLPILSRVPREPGARGEGALLPARLTAPATESFRALRATVFGSEPAGGFGQSVLVTGSSPSEGKSSTALNLAYALAQSGQRVILIEADVRRPSLARALKIHMRFGLIGVLAGQVPLDDALVTVPGYPENLKLLLVERPEPSAADRLALPIAREMLRAAQLLADFVVIDSPPLSQIVDALPLAQAADEVLIVARIGVSRVGALAELGELLAHNGITPLGVVLVGTERASRDSDYYYVGGSRSQTAASTTQTA
ncbi:MAG TPA: AAA family ATPase [Solirubrobacteraceae bacterium]|jgi:succinoglycan biosynthesis transport protein ExoP|nr:AAA family ATPase [Solirubrobacteraceae bacterium]